MRAVTDAEALAQIDTLCNDALRNSQRDPHVVLGLIRTIIAQARQSKDDWRKDMPHCNMSNDGLCVANIPAACICMKRPPGLDVSSAKSNDCEQDEGA